MDLGFNLGNPGGTAICIDHWLNYWGTATVADIRIKPPHDEAPSTKGFVEYLRKIKKKDGSPLSIGTVERIIGAGRAAINYGYRAQLINHAPFIPGVQSAREKIDAEPRARPITLGEFVRLFQEVDQPHLYVFLIASICTMGRPTAVCELSRAQTDLELNIIDLNPADRQQRSSKYRALKPLAQTLRPFVELVEDRLITFGGKPISRVVGSFATARDAAGLDRRVKPYSIRHTMGRLLRRENVPRDQISLMLDHFPVSLKRADHPYSPMDPTYCSEAVTAIDRFCDEIAHGLGHPLDPEHTPTVVGRKDYYLRGRYTDNEWRTHTRRYSMDAKVSQVAKDLKRLRKKSGIPLRVMAKTLDFMTAGLCLESGGNLRMA